MVGFGVISYSLLKIVRGRYRDVPPLLYVISAAFVIAFALPFV
jgi:AGZA family xanthine/uracil permease-like MFS transporter